MTYETAGWGAVFTSRNWLFSLAIMSGVALQGIDLYITTTTLPSIIRDIGGISYYAWNTALYEGASILGAAVAAYLLVAHGPRRAYVMAAVLFSIGSVLCGMASGMPVFLLGRAVQGAGGGILLALAYAVARIAFAESLWPRVLTLIAIVWGATTLLGPAVGGVFAEFDAWRRAFGCVIAVALGLALIAQLAFPVSADGSKLPGLPVLQLALLAATVLSVSVAGVVAAPLAKLGGIVVAIGLIYVIGRIDTKSRQRLLPDGALDPRSPLGLAFITMTLFTLPVSSSELFMPLFLQVLHGQSPLISGFLAGTMSMGWTLGSFLFAGVGRKHSVSVVTGAPILAIVGMVGLVLMVPSGNTGSLSQLVAISVCMALVGCSVGMAWPHIMTHVLRIASRDEAELASASITTVQLSATAIGAAFAGMVVNLAGMNRIGDVPRTSTAALALFSVFLAVSCGLWIVARRLGKRDMTAEIAESTATP